MARYFEMSVKKCEFARGARMLTLVRFSRFLGIALFFPLLFAEDSSFLSKNKREILSLEREQNRANSAALRWQWLRPLDLSYSILDNYDYNPRARTRSLSVGINQPIFRSGGIFQSIRFANLKERYTEAEIALKERELVMSVLRFIYTLRRLDLEREKQKLLIANSEIEVLRKQEQFRAGIADSGELDRAILERNGAELRLLELENSHHSAFMQLASVSDIEDYASVELPTFAPLSEESYMEHNLELARARLNEGQLRAKYYETSARYLPQISLQARYYHQHNSNLHPLKDGYNEYATVGVVFSLPFFDASHYANVQSAKIAQLRAGAMRMDALKAQREHYSLQMRKLELLERTRALSAVDLELYDALLAQSAERTRAGEISEFDLEIMKNSKRTKELDLRIHELNRQLILLELYAKIPE